VLHRMVLGLARKELAAEAGISYPYMAEIELGRKEPTMATLRTLAGALGVAPSTLYAFAEKIERGEPLLA